MTTTGATFTEQIPTSWSVWVGKRFANASVLAANIAVWEIWGAGALVALFAMQSSLGASLVYLKRHKRV